MILVNCSEGMSALFICGYSFSDDHINDIIVQSLRSNPTAMIYAFLYGNLYSPKYGKAVACAKSVANLSLIAFNKAIIGRTEGEWILKDDSLVDEIPGDVVQVEEKEIDLGSGVTKKEKFFELRLGDFAKFGAFLKELSFIKTDEDVKTV